MYLSKPAVPKVWVNYPLVGNADFCRLENYYFSLKLIKVIDFDFIFMTRD